MFVQLSEDKQDTLKNDGKLELVINPLVSPSSVRRKTDHIIIYNSKHVSLSLFSCIVSDMDKWLVLEDLSIRKCGVSSMKEASLYMFLGWTIECAITWASERNKRCILVHTKLPHCTEWFAEYGYAIRKLGIQKGFSGFKPITCNKGE
jgi:hypothetical protein